MLRIEYPAELPITAHVETLRTLIAEHQVVVVAGETGSGKSTQLPKICLELGRGTERLIGHTQPRRVAARTIAARVAEEIGVPLGREVAHSVRFDDRVGEATRLRVMTDGIVLAELERDPHLRRYDTLIIDEAHERSLNIDFLLGYVHRLLPERPDLRLIITSATIDTERFATHFATDGVPAPIVTVEGRGYPVEIRHRDDTPAPADQATAICEAVDELCHEGTGDVLVFVSGEREIRDATDALRRHLAVSRRLEEIEILPLYARLSTPEQQRIFAPHGRRRIVVATNVAETSITVPGVRYVVDTGWARISRYSRRLKVQRLPIEEISQASADQRAGRCGRTAPGVCIRLYSAEDYAARPEHTEPEILRTNLASVILTMMTLGLGDLETFGFLDPPDAARRRDGELLLEELGALSADDTGGAAGGGSRRRRLTRLGRRLARLPVDPRLGRMIIEADRLGCVHEVLVIAAAMSIRDPRQRPSEHREAADTLHQRFVVAGSDLVGFLRLWEYLRARQRELSGNRFRRMCRDEFLDVNRIREWEDLFSQLRRAAGQIGITVGAGTAAHPDTIHRAVLAGHLSHIGRRDGDRREYRGARDTRFTIAPGSAVTESPRWVMAAELVETDRLRARTVAAIDPGWAEKLAGHLVSRQYSEPRWDADRRRAVVTETVSLFGLPIVDGRTIGLDRVDPAEARRWFIRHALVAPAGTAAATYPFVAHNRAVVARAERHAARLRRHDLIDDEAVFEHYDRHLPAGITSGTAADRWWRTEGDRIGAALEIDESALLAGSMAGSVAGAVIDIDRWAPLVWREGDIDLEVEYRYDPDSALDGTSIRIPLAVINQITGAGVDWNVPARRADLVAALMRTLPKTIRRRLIPFAETVEAVIDALDDAVATGRIDPATTSITAAVAATLTDVGGVVVSAGDLRLDEVPSHLRVTFIITGDDDAVIDASRDLEALRSRLGAAVRAQLIESAPIAERRGITRWDIGPVPPVIEIGSAPVRRAYPALVDDDHSVSLRILTDRPTRDRVMRAGIRRLLVLNVAPTPAALVARLDTTSMLAIAGTGVDVAELATDAIDAAVDHLLSGHGPDSLPGDEAAFGALADAVEGRIAPLATDALAAAIGIVAQAGVLDDRLAALVAPALEPTVTDCRAQIERLVGRRFVVIAGTRRLPDVARYLRGIEYRLDRLAGAIDRDRARMAEIAPLETRYRRLVARHPPSAELAEIGWHLEELRIATFAQALGPVGSPSTRRISRLLEGFEAD